MTKQQTLHIRRVKGQDSDDELYEVYVGHNREVSFRPTESAAEIGRVILHCLGIAKKGEK